MGKRNDILKQIDMEAVEDFKQDKVANIPNSLLISASYNGKTKKVSLKFYNPETEKIYLWEDKTCHQPYCFSKMAPEDLDFLSERDDVVEIKTVKKIDTLKDKEIPVSKIIVTDPLAIGGTQTTQSIRNVVEAWESDIKYYETYLYDNSLIIGKYYRIENDTIIPHDFEMSDETNLAMKSMLFDKLGNTGMTDTKQFQEEVSNWAELLDQPVPKIKRMSLDIEVETDGRLPDVKIADKKVTAIGFEASDGMRRVFVLKRDGIEEGVNDLDKNIEVMFYEKDQEEISKRIKDLGLENDLINHEGLTAGMLVTLGEQKILTLTDLADLASDELTGTYDVVKGERVKIKGYLEDFALSKLEADNLVMSARDKVYKD